MLTFDAELMPPYATQETASAAHAARSLSNSLEEAKLQLESSEQQKLLLRERALIVLKIAAKPGGTRHYLVAHLEIITGTPQWITTISIEVGSMLKQPA